MSDKSAQKLHNEYTEVKQVHRGQTSTQRSGLPARSRRMTVTPADLLSGGLPVSVAVTCKYSSECTEVT